MSSSTTLPYLLSQLEKSCKSYNSALWQACHDHVEDTVKYLYYRRANAAIVSCLTDICKTVRVGAVQLEPADLKALLDRAAELESEIVDATSSERYLHNFISVYCGNDVKDPCMGDLALAYDGASKPAANSTPLARFDSRQPPILTSAPPTLRAFAEARCEVACDDLPVVINMMDTSGSVLAVQGAGGYKDRVPTLQLYNLASPWPFAGLSVVVGLSRVACHMQLDGGRKLVYVADRDRVKSYRWNFDGEDEEGYALAVHTLRSAGYDGVMALKENGTKLVRTGSKGMAVWDIETLQTHGEDGDDIIGHTIDSDSLRDNDGEAVELSSGSAPTQHIAAPAMARMTCWTENPSEAKEMIVTYETQYGVARLDLETQQIAGRYVGHGARVSSIRTSAGDARSFVTAANDGVVRLYDVRMPAPVLAVEHRQELLCSALYEHVSGQPFVIVGGSKSEQVKVWDARAKLPLYELSTGNNEVNALVWDAPRQTLYAGTECQYADRIGNHHGYRRARLPKTREAEDEDMEYDDDWDSGNGMIWPKRAYHSETSFGHFLDSAEHRLYQYRFNADADAKIVPESGYSSTRDNYGRLW